MIPIYRYMDSHPFQKNQTPLNPYQYPNMESVPSYLTMDPAKSCMPSPDSGRNCWHYGYPMPPYSCYNGGTCFPSYSNFRPLHLPVPPHHHMHSYGGYPPCPEPYHLQYVPPTHYNVDVEQPRYEFDKNMMRNHHCCGCPNSLCGQNQKEDKCVKIEEEKPDNQRKGSLVPFQNNQSPIVWFPPDYMESEKEREPSAIGTVKQEKGHHGSKLKSVEQAPKFWNGWPLSDLIRRGSWLPDAECMGTQSVQNKQQEDGKKEYPFPNFLMPARKADVQNVDAPRKYTEESSNVGKLVPTNILQKYDPTSEGPEVVKTINQSNIPETVMNHRTEDVNKKKERRCIPVETVKDNKERELSRNNVKGESSSSPKKSRLPPVCLRVDPLPKKKNGNDSSRSQGSPNSTSVKESSRSDSKIIKALEVKTHEKPEDTSSAGEPLSLPTQPQPQEKLFDNLCKEETEESKSLEYREKDRTISQVSTEKAVDEGLEVRSEDLVQEEGKNEKRNLSDVEAVVLIQSAYRGYEVRKWELLKKMKQLAEVRQQVIEVQNRVKALELVPKDEKERMFVGEMIMRLLLKLDTIQGLHPSVKEFRKSLAKELVALQEKLDCMVIKPPEVVPEASIEKPIEHFDVETHDDIKEEEHHKDDVVAIDEIFPKGANESSSLMGESHGAQSLGEIDNMADFEGVKSPGDERLTRYGHTELLEVDDQNTNVSEAEQLVEELREHGVQNEGTFELSSQNFSYQIEGDKVMRSLMGVKKSDEAESGAEMEQNVEVVNNAEKKVGKVLQTNVKEETVDDQAYSLEEDGQHPRRDSCEELYVSNCISDDQEGTQARQTPGVLDKITISAPAEDQLAADMELPMREDDSPNNIEADQMEHIEMRREVPEAEENAHYLEVELSSDRTLNKKEGQEECPVLSVGFEHNEECPSCTKCENEKEGASDESAVLRSNSNDDLNIQSEWVTKRNEQQTSDEVEKVLEDVQHQPKPSSELDNQANKLHAAGEATSTEMSKESLPASPNASRWTDQKDLGSEKEMDKKLVEENEKMRDMVEKLMEVSKEQIAIISKLSGRVKDVEKRFARKKKVRRGCGMSMSRHSMLNGHIKA